MEISFDVNKERLLNEVAMSSSYTGKKMDSDANAYERISTVDEDAEQLERFFNEARAELCQEIQRLVVSDGMKDAQTYRLVLDVSQRFDNALLPSMEASLFSYFVQAMLGKWFVFTNKEEAGAYADQSKVTLDDFCRKAYHKGRPGLPAHYL